MSSKKKNPSRLSCVSLCTHSSVALCTAHVLCTHRRTRKFTQSPCAQAPAEERAGDAALRCLWKYLLIKRRTEKGGKSFCFDSLLVFRINYSDLLSSSFVSFFYRKFYCVVILIHTHLTSEVHEDCLCDKRMQDYVLSVIPIIMTTAWAFDRSEIYWIAYLSARKCL